MENKIAIIGLGYVGLPLAVAFAEKYSVIGYDINKKRVNQLLNGNDTTLEISNEQIKSVLEVNNSKNKGLTLTSDKKILIDCNIYIVTVPTPIDKSKKPDLSLMYRATENIATLLKKDDLVIYESTVYPGVTEDEMAPILEKISGLKFNKDFFCGYSPERINPGDKKHTLTKILKVTSGSTNETAEKVDYLYKSIINAGTFKASSIKVAEAAKVIENSQRDINIAFINELSKIFTLLNIDTQEVLQAAGTKWNFLNFKPGLVGGHCIGVDPYYLAQKAQEMGYIPEIILSGRRLNDSMGKHVANEVVKLLMRKNISVIDSKALVLGFTFKEDCPDIRNTRVIDIVDELKNFEIKVDIYDPWVNKLEVKNEYKIDVLENKPNMSNYSAIILAVAHKAFFEINIKENNNCVVFDVKGILPKEQVDARL